MIKIVIADDHELIREGIKRIVGHGKEIRVVGEADNIADTIQLTELHRPDVVILDINLSGQTGLGGLVELRRRFPVIPILVLSMHPEEHFGVQALKDGADGYLTKSMAAEEVAKAVHRVYSGEPYISPHLAKLLAVEVRDPRRRSPHDVLTTREMQVVSLFCAGKKAKQIAAELAISVSSVNTYRQRIFDKLQVSSIVDLVRYSVEHRLV